MDTCVCEWWCTWTHCCCAMKKRCWVWCNRSALEETMSFSLLYPCSCLCFVWTASFCRTDECCHESHLYPKQTQVYQCHVLIVFDNHTCITDIMWKWRHLHLLLLLTQKRSLEAKNLGDVQTVFTQRLQAWYYILSQRKKKNPEKLQHIQYPL